MKSTLNNYIWNSSFSVCLFSTRSYRSQMYILHIQIVLMSVYSKDIGQDIYRVPWFLALIKYFSCPRCLNTRSYSLILTNLNKFLILKRIFREKQVFFWSSLYVLQFWNLNAKKKKVFLLKHLEDCNFLTSGTHLM